ncbi:MAG: 50S ribosomal protein L44e [Candidatus Pacearchaeota archaeon]|jgi:ribosomal protein L44E
MKIPKATKRFCPYCKKKTEQKVDLVSTGFKRGTLARGSLSRVKLRGKNRGMGNHGKYSRKAIKAWKRKTKTTMRRVIIYSCKICKKSKLSKKSRRVSKIMVE